LEKSSQDFNKRTSSVAKKESDSPFMSSKWANKVTAEEIERSIKV
jgi:hypothetical protein